VGAPTNQSAKESAASDEQSAQDWAEGRGESRQGDHTRERESEHPPERRPESLGRSNPPEPLTESGGADDEQNAAHEAPDQEAAASETMTNDGAECRSRTAEHAHREEQQRELHAHKLVCPGPRAAKGCVSVYVPLSAWSCWRSVAELMMIFDPPCDLFALLRRRDGLVQLLDESAMCLLTVLPFGVLLRTCLALPSLSHRFGTSSACDRTTAHDCWAQVKGQRFPLS